MEARQDPLFCHIEDEPLLHKKVSSLTRWCFLQMFAILFDPFASRLLKTLQEMKWWLNI